MVLCRQELGGSLTSEFLEYLLEVVARVKATALGNDVVAPFGMQHHQLFGLLYTQ